MTIPIIVDYEIKRGFYHTKNHYKESIYTKMRTHCPVVEMSALAWDKAASIWAMQRKAGQTVGDIDIIIAAHCIENGYTLITHNTKHFKLINGLHLLDWA